MAFGLSCLGPASRGEEARRALRDCLALGLPQPRQVGDGASLRDLAVRTWALAVVTDGGLGASEWAGVAAEVSRRYGYGFGRSAVAELDEATSMFLVHTAVLSSPGDKLQA